MDKDEFDKIVQGLKALIDLRNGFSDKCTHEDECEDDEECDIDKSCEITRSLEKDYNDFMIWAFNSKEKSFDKNEARKKWKKNHEKLAMPRILETDVELDESISTLCLFIDAYPMYLEAKKSTR